jgi:kumamolisin
VPPALRGEVQALGRVGSMPFDLTAPLVAPAAVPAGGLTPEGGLRAYNALPLAEAGYTGKGQTVVFPEVTAFDQADMDKFTEMTGLPPISVERSGPFSGNNEEALETTMDIQVVHALAPDAKLVIADLGVVSNSAAAIAQFFSQLDQQYPGAIWSVSFILGCDKMYSATDLQVIDQAVATALSHGTTAFISSGDADGLECKEFLQQNFNSPPSLDDIGLNAVGAIPSMTSAGGTALSVTTSGDWLSEAVWADPTLTLGTGGGASTTVARPDFQQGVGEGLPAETAGYRLVPDLSADADSRTGFLIVSGGEPSQGGGTSQAAPILAGLTAVMNDYLDDNGGHAIGAINPLLYQIGTGNPEFPAFHDVTLGGNALWYATPGYDLATGWGTPNTWNLVRDILAIQKGGG